MSGVAHAEGAELVWWSEGSGPDVLLLHSGVGDARQWGPLRETLAGAVRTIRFDMRGFGESRYEAGEFSPAADAAAVLDAAGADRAIVVGNSFGGLVALDLASRFPDRVAGLVLCASAIDDWDWSEAAEAFFDGEGAAIEAGDLDTAVRLNVDLWCHGDAHRALIADSQRAAFELQLAAEPEPVFGADPASTRCPARILTGEHDLPDYADIGAHLAATMPAATLEHVENAGHLIPLDRPDVVARAILDLL